MASEIISILNDIKTEIRIIKMKIESIEDKLGEEMSEDEREALREALEEYKKGETIPLEEVEKEIEAES